MNISECAAFLNALQNLGTRYSWFPKDSEPYEALEIGKNCAEAWDKVLTRAKEDKELAVAVDKINNFLREEENV